MQRTRFEIPVSILGMKLKMKGCRSTWVAQLAECPTLAFSSVRSWSQGHGIEPCMGLLTEHGVCLGSSLSLVLSLTLALSFSTSSSSPLSPSPPRAPSFCLKLKNKWRAIMVPGWQEMSTMPACGKISVNQFWKLSFSFLAPRPKKKWSKGMGNFIKLDFTSLFSLYHKSTTLQGNLTPGDAF